MTNLLKKFISSFFINENYISPESKDLAGKVIVVTGSSRGIGKAIIQVLLKAGANLVLISREQTKDIQKSLTGIDQNRYLILAGNIFLEDDVERMTSEILRKFGKIDVLVNNAGIFMEKALDQVTLSEFDSIVNTNIKGVFLMTRAVLPLMKKRKEGFIINIGSKISHNTNVSPNKVLYATTKYAIEGFSFALNRELKKYGIRVACLMPGTVNTFVSLKSKNYLSVYDLGFLVQSMIKAENIDFESVLIKSRKQDI